MQVKPVCQVILFIKFIFLLASGINLRWQVSGLLIVIAAIVGGWYL